MTHLENTFTTGKRFGEILFAKYNAFHGRSYRVLFKIIK